MSKNIEKIYKNSIEQIVPDILDNILAQDVVPMEREDDIICQTIKNKKNPKRNRTFLCAISVAVAAIFLLFLHNRSVIETRIIIDVNPSFEVQLNKQGQVKKVIGINKDAQNILEKITFTDENLNNTIEKLIKTMDENGYFKNKTAVLVSVQNKQKNTALHIENTIKKQIKNLCKNSETNPIIYTQSIENNKEIQKVAQNYHISNGRATLIYKMLKKDNSWKIEDLSSMTIDELLDAAKKKDVKISEILEKNERKTTTQPKKEKTEKKKKKVTPSPDTKTKKKNAQQTDNTEIDVTIKPSKKEKKPDNKEDAKTNSEDAKEKKKDKEKKKENNSSPHDTGKTDHKNKENKREKKKPDEGKENPSVTPFNAPEKQSPEDKENKKEEHPPRDRRDDGDNKNKEHEKN